MPDEKNQAKPIWEPAWKKFETGGQKWWANILRFTPGLVGAVGWWPISQQGTMWPRPGEPPADPTTTNNYRDRLKEYVRLQVEAGLLDDSQATAIMTVAANGVKAGQDIKNAPYYSELMSNLPTYIKNINKARQSANEVRIERESGELAQKSWMPAREAELANWKTAQKYEPLGEIDLANRQSDQSKQALWGNGVYYNGEQLKPDENMAGFEELRKQKLAQYGTPRDWINRYIWQNKPNPYQPTGGSLGEAQAGAARNMAEASYWSTVAENYAGDPIISGIAGEAATGASQRANEAQQQAGQLQASGYKAPSYQQNQLWPSTPQWLAPMTAGLKPGQPMWGGSEEQPKTPAIAPSGQQWARLLPTQQEEFAGYTDFTGQKINDVLAKSEMMQPYSPKSPVRWRPARQ